MCQQSTKQKKYSQVAEEGARNKTDSAAASDKQEARGRSKDTKKAENRQHQRRECVTPSAEDKRAIKQNDKVQQSEKKEGNNTQIQAQSAGRG